MDGQKDGQLQPESVSPVCKHRTIVGSDARIYEDVRRSAPTAIAICQATRGIKSTHTKRKTQKVDSQLAVPCDRKIV
jgi:hypothetical protein